MSRAFSAWVTSLGLVGAGAGVAGSLGVVSGGAALGGSLVALAGVLGGVALASARPDLEIFGPSVQRARHPGRAALTIDDGPHPASTEPMLAALAERGLHATFFVLGDRVRKYPALFQRMVAEGHEVGLHGMGHHPWLTVKSPRSGAAELRAACDVLVEHGAPAPTWYRPPFGATSPRVYAAVAAAGLRMAWCSVRTRDGVPIAPETLRARCRGVVGTDIVLLHEGEGPTHRLLAEILDEWDARGIRASTLSAALEEGA